MGTEKAKQLAAADLFAQAMDLLDQLVCKRPPGWERVHAIIGIFDQWVRDADARNLDIDNESLTSTHAAIEKTMRERREVWCEYEMSVPFAKLAGQPQEVHS